MSSLQKLQIFELGNPLKDSEKLEDMNTIFLSSNKYQHNITMFSLTSLRPFLSLRLGVSPKIPFSGL